MGSLIIICVGFLFAICCIWEDKKNELEDRKFDNWKPSDHWKLPDNSFCWNEEDLGPVYSLGCSVEDCTFQSASGCEFRTTNLKGARGDKKISNTGDCSYYTSHEAVIRWKKEEENREKKMIDGWRLEEKKYNNSLLAIEDKVKRAVKSDHNDTLCVVEEKL